MPRGKPTPPVLGEAHPNSSFRFFSLFSNCCGRAKASQGVVFYLERAPQNARSIFVRASFGVPSPDQADSPKVWPRKYHHLCCSMAILNPQGLVPSVISQKRLWKVEDWPLHFEQPRWILTSVDQSPPGFRKKGGGPKCRCSLRNPRQP